MRKGTVIASGLLAAALTVGGDAVGEPGTWERPKTTRRYLQGPESERLHTFWREGKLVFGEIWHTDDWTYEYERQPAHGVWLVREGKPLGFKAAELNRTDDGVPDHAQTWRTDGLEIELAACAPCGRTPDIFARLTVRNVGTAARTERIGFLLRDATEKELVFHAPDIYRLYDPKVEDWLKIPAKGWRREGRTMRSGDRFVAFGGEAAFAWDAASGEARFEMALGAGETRRVELSIGRGEVPKDGYEAARERTVAEWRKILARLKMPERIRKDREKAAIVRNAVVQMLQCYAKPVGEDVTLPRQGGLQRYAWPGETMQTFVACDMTGFGEYAERALEFYMMRCVRESGEAGPFRNEWAGDTACVLMSFARHCCDSGNAAFWRKHRAAAERMFRWIQGKRGKDGLFPPMKSTDEFDFPIRHWGQTDMFATDAFGWYAKGAERFGDATAEEARRAHADYRRAMVRILDRWRAASEGKDELHLPIDADGKMEDELIAKGFFYVHPGAFADSGLLTAEELTRLHRWIERRGFANERGLTMRHPSRKHPELGEHIWYTTWTEMQWFRAWKRIGREDLAAKALEAALTFAQTDER